MKNERNNRLGEEKLNNQNCLMKIIEYNGAQDIVVEFQDEHKSKVHTTYYSYKIGGVKNPYYPSVHGVGIIGEKYSSQINSKRTKEYTTWTAMLKRCLDIMDSTYKDVVCCDEWLLFENFYEWVHSQENFEKWSKGKRWELDKDILIKGNKIYSPNTCCLVPHIVNSIFVKSDKIRGDLPIGVCKLKNKYESSCKNLMANKKIHIGTYSTPEEAFYTYKEYKENYIKQIAQEEYNKGNITKQCYDAMMNYKVEITD